MKIRHDFYTELKEEFELCTADAPASPAADASEEDLSLFEHLILSERFRRFRKAARQQSLTKEAFDRLCGNAFKLAESVGLNLLMETQGLAGQISLSAPSLSLHTPDDHLHISRLLELLSRADQLRFDSVIENGETLLRLSLYYDLSL